jgi:predicted ATPase
LPPRQRSMQAVFQRSWDLLTPQEQAVLARLTIFRGGFSRDTAQQVAGANLRVLLSLISKSLVQRSAEEGRFTMHELLRQFAAQRRRPEEKISLLHCRYFAQLAKEEFYKAQGPYPYHLA